MSAYPEWLSDDRERAKAIARNVAAAPRFTTDTLEWLARVIGPAAAEVAREKRQQAKTRVRGRSPENHVPVPVNADCSARE
jgi:hypothetical protein